MAAPRRFGHHRPKLVQALRMTASALAAFALVSTLGLPQGFWAVITALIVTQGNVGGSLKAALDRFVGSVFGAVYGGAVASAIPHAAGPERAAALAVAVAPLSVVAAFSAGFRIAPITAVIVLLGTAGATLGPFGFAVDRILEIGIGCAVGVLVSLLVVPARASHAVLDAAARVAGLMADQLDALAAPPGRERAEADLASLVVRTRQGLTRLETLVGEAARERRSHLTADSPDPEPVFRTVLRLRHDLVMLRRAVLEPGHEAPLEHPAEPWARAAAAGAAALRDAGQALRARRAPAASGTLAEAVAAYGAAVDGTVRRDAMRSLSADAVGRMFAAAFALDQFRRDLDDLAERARERAAGSEEAARA